MVILLNFLTGYLLDISLVLFDALGASASVGGLPIGELGPILPIWLYSFDG